MSTFEDTAELEETWNKAYTEIMTELYDEAVPGTNYDNLTDEEIADNQPPLYLQHYLPASTQEELIEDTCDQYDILEELYFEAKKSVMLSHGPSTSLDNVDRARFNSGLKRVSVILREMEDNSDVPDWFDEVDEL